MILVHRHDLHPAVPAAAGIGDGVAGGAPSLVRAGATRADVRLLLHRWRLYPDSGHASPHHRRLLGRPRQPLMRSMMWPKLRGDASAVRSPFTSFAAAACVAP